MQCILKLPRAWVVLCILPLTMAMGRLLGEFVDREARAVTPSVRQDLQLLLSEKGAGWGIYGEAAPDGEETANVFEAWPDIARCLGFRLGSAKYKAAANMGDLLQALYCTYKGTNLVNCAAVAGHCITGTASWYRPRRLGIGVGNILWRHFKSIKNFLKHGHNEHSNQGGGGASGGGGG